MALDLLLELSALRDLDLDELRLRWKARFGRAAPAQIPRSLLFRLFSYRLQAEVIGDLSPGTLQLLERLGRANGDKSVPLPAIAEVKSRAGLQIGTVLMREYQGKSHQAVVTQEGFTWNGRTFDNLSQVAMAITGTKWNGPRFFGLRDQGRST